MEQTTTDTGYVMGRSSEEYQRLKLQAQVLEPATRRILDQLGLRSGLSCLDVGCGPGEVMRLMGEMVGSAGTVTGLDWDGRLGREALGILKATTDSRFAFVEGDVTTLEELPGQPFDLTFTRIMLIHTRDPVAVLRKMFSWTKPGGYIVAQDYDFRTMDIYPRLDAWTEFVRVFEGVFEQSGLDTRIGHKLAAHFVAAGIGEPDGTDVTGRISPLPEASIMFKAVYQSILPRALELGLTTVEKSRSFFSEVEEAVTSGCYHASLWPLLIGVWKRKPQEGQAREIVSQ
jgi:ubiquinone/menaquinone biosynthesis C-methylase UbiE